MTSGGSSSNGDSRSIGYGSVAGSARDDHFAPTTRRHQQRWPWLRVGIASVAAVATLGFYGATRLAETPSLSGVGYAVAPSPVDQNLAQTADRGGTPRVSGARGSETASTREDQEELSFVASNEYTRRGDTVGRGYPWLEGRILVEPFRMTTLEVVSPKEGMTYKWKVSALSPEVTVVDKVPMYYAGASVVVKFERSPVYSIVLEEWALGGNADGKEGWIARSTRVEVFCKYVRREIRSLFDDERDEMFDAMKVLWDVPRAEGMQLYGPDYMDVWTIDMFHQVGASDILCDHLHDGIGFGVTHSMVTMMFENSLQLVNPKIALPYWDFTIEGAVVDLEMDGDYTRLAEASPLWGPDWFGGVDPVDFQVKDGRWGSLPVPIIDEDARLDLGADVYGRMRSPWNVNSRPYLTRGLGEMCGLDSTEFYTWPGCSSHFDLTDVFSSYYAYTWWSQYGPHGPIHVWVGGNVDCKKDLDTVMEIVGEDYRVSMSGYMFVQRKDMFRDTMFKCVGYADIDMTEEEIMKSGMCGCLDMDLSPDGDDYVGVFENFSSFYSFDQDFTEEQKRILAAQWCNGQVGMGESSQSSSPLDPTFWSMHPTMERLLSFKLLSGTFTDWSWPDEVGYWVGMDGTVYDIEISTRSDTCYGHRGSDVFPYEILGDNITPQFTFYGSKGVNTLQNRELIKLFDPNENALPFIYDNFEWEHCEALGFDFSVIFDTSTMEAGSKYTATAPENGSPRAERVEGFELFERSANNRNPGFDPPAKIKKMMADREEQRRKFLEQRRQQTQK